MKLKTLSIITAVLFLFSIAVYYNENKRGTDLVTGSDYIKGLDISKVHKISLSFKEGQKISLVKDNANFILESHKSYPASTEKMNDLIYKIASIAVKEKVKGSPSEGDLKNYELDEKSRKYLIEIFDKDGKNTVSFSVGKTYKGKGSYLFKKDGKAIYLSEASLWLNSSYKDLVNTLLLNIKKDDIERLHVSSDREIELVKKDKEFVLEQPKIKSFKKESVDGLVSNFGNLRFEDYYTQNEDVVQGLSFKNDIKVQLKSKLIYKLSFAKEKDNHFVKLSALVNEVPQKITINKDDDKERIKEIENMVKAQGVAQKFNIEKGRWIYKINKDSYSKFAKPSSEFL